MFWSKSRLVLQFCAKAWHCCPLVCAIRYPAVSLAYESVGGIRAHVLGPVRTLSSQCVRVAGRGGGKQLSIARGI